MSKIKYYPVGNGDMSLIILDDESTILVDCNIREASKDEENNQMFDVKDDLLKSCKKRNDNPFIDVYVLTHGDIDHCRGFKKNFYQGDPTKYSEKNRKAGEIIIEEMWFSPMMAEKNSNDEEDAHQAEAERRLGLHLKNDSQKDLPGNRIKIIGYDTKKDYSKLNHLRIEPGNEITRINNKLQNTFSVFIHAPFKEHIESDLANKNNTSIVFQARFKYAPSDSDYVCRAMFGGDSDYNTWQVILDKTLKHKKVEALHWDIFLAPHHCSWTFFNETPYKDAENDIDNSTPRESSLKVLSYKLSGAKVVTSSKLIVDDDDNPPHYPAKEEYIQSVNEDNFLNTDAFFEDYDLPIVFRIDKYGPTLLKSDIKTAISTGAVPPPRAGRN